MHIGAISNVLGASSFYVRQAAQELDIEIITQRGIAHISGSDCLRIKRHLREGTSKGFSGLISGEVTPPATKETTRSVNHVRTDGIHRSSYLAQLQETVVFQAPVVTAKKTEPAPVPEGLVDTEAAMDILGVSQSTFIKLRSKHSIYPQAFGKRHYYDEALIRRLVSERGEERQGRSPKTTAPRNNQAKESKVSTASPSTPEFQPEIPTNHISTNDAATLIGVSPAEFYTNKRFGLSPVRRGPIVYYDREDVLKAKEERRTTLEKQRKQIERKVLPVESTIRQPRPVAEKTPKVRAEPKASPVVPEGYIDTNDVRQMLGKGPRTLDTFRKNFDINPTKVGSSNYFSKTEIEEAISKQAKQGEARKRSNIAKTSSTTDGSDLDSFNQFISESRRRKILSPEGQFALGAKIFSAKLAINGAESLLMSRLLNDSQLQRLSAALSNPTVELMAANAKREMLADQAEVRGRTVNDIIDSYQKYIENKLKEAQESEDPAVLENLINNTLRLIENGRKALHEMVETNIRLGIKPAKRYARYSNLEMSDLMSYTNEGLMIAAAKYDFRRGFRFSTYAMNWIKQKIARGVDDDESLIRVPVHMSRKAIDLTRRNSKFAEGDESSRLTPEELEKLKIVNQARYTTSLDMPIGEDGESTLIEIIGDTGYNLAEDVENSVLADEVDTILSTLTPRQAEIIRLRFGIGNEPAQTLEEVGKRYGITRERIRQIEGKALTRLRNNPVALEQLRPFLT